ncbi:MAG: metallopeptidase family protein [Planctomycetes bacterium]|nr:metallopeptidase family protein [Planctomycetota bacterium]MCC7170778.1 metallopeptidase family protein [Planctomycetota bacterium]
MPKSNDRDDVLDDAWAALDEGNPEQSLRLIKRLDADDPERALLEAASRCMTNDLGGSRRALDRSRELGMEDDDPDLLWTEGELLLREWRIGDALASFEALAAQERSAGVLERLSFCAELLGDAEKGLRLMTEASALDPDSAPPIPHLGAEDFDQVLREAIEALPDQFQNALGAVRLVVEPFPTRELARQGDPAEVAPDILGLFSGPSLLDGEHELPAGPPPTIHVFQRNLERTCIDHDELREQIRITLYHELGHFLGFDEEGVDRMGLG